MKKILWINYIYTACYIVFFFYMVLVAITYQALIPKAISYLIVVITLILTILFFRNKANIPKALVLTFNILVLTLFLISPVWRISQGILSFSIVGWLFIMELPFIVNVFMLYKDRYKEL